MDSEPYEQVLEIGLFLASLQVGLSGGVLISLILVILLLLCSALISGSEVAYFSLSAGDMEQLSEEKSPISQRLLDLKDRPRTLLATILIANNFINIGIVLISEFILRNLLSDSIRNHWSTYIIDILGLKDTITVTGLAAILNFLIAVIGVTFILVLFGEVAPKIYANFNNLRLARLMSGPLTVLGKIFSPVSGILVRWTNLIEHRIDNKSQKQSALRKKDIGDAIDLTVQKQLDIRRDIDVLKSILKFSDVSVKQIMQPRVDVVAVDYKTTYKEVGQIVRDSGYSRIPVFDNDFDHVTGILYSKDLLPHMEEEDTYEWQELIRTNIMYVPESKRISDLLREFQGRKMHMAVVVDEYGGSSGIVTLEDIMEEVIGEIKDEFDTEQELDYQRIDDYNYIFEGKTQLNDVCRVLGIDTNTFDDTKGDSDSFAGLILEILGQIPKKGTEIRYKSFIFRIESVDDRRIRNIRIILPKD